MIPGWPNTQTSSRPATLAPPIGAGKVFTTDHLCPSQRSTREPAPTSVKAHRSDGDVAPAATTCSPRRPGNATRVQVFPVRRHAVGTVSGSATALPLNAQAESLPVATTAVKSPAGPERTCLAMCHACAGGTADAVPATAATPPVSATSPATPAAIPATLPIMCSPYV